MRSVAVVGMRSVYVVGMRSVIVVGMKSLAVVGMKSLALVGMRSDCCVVTSNKEFVSYVRYKFSYMLQNTLNMKMISKYFNISS